MACGDQNYIRLGTQLVNHTHFDERRHPVPTGVSTRPPPIASGWESTNLLIPLADLIK